MRLLLLTALLFLESLSLSIFLVAHAQTGNKDCSTTLIEVRDELEKGRDLNVILVQSRDMSQGSEEYPTGRPMSYEFKLDGSATSNVMNSSQMLSALSTRVINGCDSVSKVTFGVNRTDWYSIYGYMGEGRVGAFRCVEPDRSRRTLAWGYTVCL